MKRIILIFTAAVAAVLAASCNPETQDPIAKAIENELMKSVEGKYSFRMDRLALVDSTTFLTEFERRNEIFETKKAADFKLYNDFSTKGLRKNMAKKAEDIERDNEILEGLQALKDNMGGKVDGIAYYDCLFTAVAKVSGQTQILENYYATVTPDHRVISICASKKDLHKATGKVIPGYMELLGSDEEIVD